MQFLNLLEVKSQALHCAIRSWMYKEEINIECPGIRNFHDRQPISAA
jgi:hypothetical protein